MWNIPQINSPCEVVKTIWNLIVEANGEEIEHQKLLKLLLKTLRSSTPDICEQYVSSALNDNLLVKSIKPKTRKRKKISTVYTLPKWQEFSFFEEQSDFWCYECHTTGTVLKCESCFRSFHERCRKTFEEKQLELEPYVPKQKRITKSSFGSGSTVPRRQSNASVVETPSPLLIENSVACSDTHAQPMDDVQMIESNATFPAAGNATVKHETFSEGSIKQEVDRQVSIDIDEKVQISMDIEEMPEFVCVVRPPDRRLEERLNTPSVKPEDSDEVESALQQHDLDEVKRFCYACRLLKSSANNAPPHVGKQELNYLLNFTIEQYKSWLPEDTFSLTKLRNGKAPQTPAWNRKTIDICKKMFLRQEKSIAYIRKEIAEERYNSLDEFHVDLLDVAHSIAIIHGVSSLEYDAMMYFLADCVYDLYEIRQCPDCYRHSNEKHDPDFFVKPCRTRHELVYAKQKSYQYWPAKVMRVVNNKYDVRFFGHKHFRALLDASCVKPIDTEPSVLKINLKSWGVRHATEELLKHQALLDGPREAFAFGSTPLTASRVSVPSVANTDTALPVESPAATAPTVVARRMQRGRLNSVMPNADSHLPLETPSRAHMVVAGMQRRLLTDSPNASQQYSSDEQSSPASASTNSNPKARTLKRQQPTPRDHAAKRNRNNNTISANNQLNIEFKAPVVAPSNNNNTLGNNCNGHMAETPIANSTRLPRTKQNLKQMFAKLSSPNKLKALLDQTNDPEEIKAAALKALQENEERCERKINWLKETHIKLISEAKKKQWCATCEEESTLACCWNTSYCSPDCQSKHWLAHQRDHKS